MRPVSVVGIVILIGLTGCFGPKDMRPGMRLPGEVAATPSDWSFTNDYPEIALEVRTPYVLPHSVTIVCSELDGDLYVGAIDPESKSWPGRVDDDPEVRLGIGDWVYEVKLVPIRDPAHMARIRQASDTKYGRKYRGALPPGEEPPQRRWKVQPRT